MDPRYYGLFEVVLTGGGVLAFAWWQLRSLKRDRAITQAREAERVKTASGSVIGSGSDDCPSGAIGRAAGRETRA